MFRAKLHSPQAVLDQVPSAGLLWWAVSAPYSPWPEALSSQFILLPLLLQMSDLHHDFKVLKFLLRPLPLFFNNISSINILNSIMVSASQRACTDMEGGWPNVFGERQRNSYKECLSLNCRTSELM